ncbi:Crp/Fnr family transcriptional regulator [Geodermatophilus sp. SYSU D00684]
MPPPDPAPDEARPAPQRTGAKDPRRNLILRALPDAEYERLLPALQPVTLQVRDQLYRRDGDIDAVYFPVDGVLSVVASVEGEPAVEVATIGYEGVSGLPVFLGTPTSPHDCFCQVAGDALCVATADLRRFLSGDGALHDLLHRYTQAMVVQLSQNVACNRLHSTEERCARWLLQTRDRVGADEFQLTQDFLGQMLGVRRGTVSLVAGLLQQAGLIRYSRGRITVVDPERLHEAACDCYDVVQAESRRVGLVPEPPDGDTTGHSPGD